ncbi:MAG: acyltransferase [Candidatus Omnitrophica bacterium]|nr:acyltransferase [Candidatus Omnitrophota bacterium]
MLKSNEGRIPELDVLRGLAALAVLCVHYTTSYTEEYFPPYPTLFDFSKGGYGVHLFFMISGFVIFMTLEKTKKPMDFFVSRFSRLYPAYWVAVIITFCSVRFFHLPLPLGDVTNKEALVNLTMFQEWFDMRNVDRAYWTLTVELSFYILMFVLFLKKGLKHIEWLGLLWLMVMVVTSRLYWYGHIHMPMWIRHSQMLNYGHLFFAGILFYNLKNKGDVWYRYLGLGLCLITGFLVRKHSADIYFEAAFFIIFFLFIRGYLSWLVMRPLVFLGTISYSLYLTHEYIGFIIIRYLFSIKMNAWVCFLLPTACAIGLATTITYFIEKPAIKWIRRKPLS